MRAPLAPSKSPGRDNEVGRMFSISQVLGYGKNNTSMQEAVNRTSREDFDDPSLLVENMTGAFAQRCDNLMNDLGAAEEAPGLFGPGWTIPTLEAGLMNEAWMFFWSSMRPVKGER